MKNIFFLLAAVFLIATSCNKKNQEPSEGSYSGTFTVEYNGNPPFGSATTESGPVTLHLLENNNFHCTSNPDRYPAGGAGSYSVNNNEINFEDQGIWTADFDWNLILNDAYSYTFDGENLKIWAEKNNVGTYTYELIKD